VNTQNLSCGRTGLTRWSLAALVMVMALLQGCATAPNANPRDPWEPFNRGVSDFNEQVDDAVLRPVAKAYQLVLPQVVRTGVTNFFGNISDVWSLVNNVLQLKPRESAETLARIGVNTIVGLGGLIDVASDIPIEKHREDFGQTLGYWGMSTGPYLVLPLLGPSTLRDAAALSVNWSGDLVSYINDPAARVSLSLLRGIDIRANLFGAGNFLNNAALDKYSFVRDAYLQRRRGETREVDENGAPAEERFDLPEKVPAPSPAPAGFSAPPMNGTVPAPDRPVKP
jgi:phospholipid-binding lipoprotein MlaA